MIYLFGEIHSEAKLLHGKAGTDDIMNELSMKICKLRSVIEEKHIKKVYFEGGWGAIWDFLIKEYPNVDVVALYEDPLITSSDIDLHMKIEQLLERCRRNLADPQTVDYNIHRRLIAKIDEMHCTVGKIYAMRENYWVQHVQKTFMNPSLVYCGRAHICPVEEDREFFPLGDRIWLPELFKNRGYDVEIVFVESGDDRSNDSHPTN